MPDGMHHHQQRPASLLEPEKQHWKELFSDQL